MACSWVNEVGELSSVWLSDREKRREGEERERESVLVSMPSSDCELLVTKYCPPPHVDVINSENSGVKGKVKTIRTAEEEEVAPDKHGDVNKQNTPLRHEPSSYGFRGDCQCATEAVCGAVADLDGNTTQNGHGMNGYVNGAVSIEGEKRCNLACNDREILCQSLEKRHVHDVYEDTAHHFKHARYKPWPKVKEFLEELPAGSIVADIGEFFTRP